MALPTVTGYLNIQTNTVEPNNTDTWADLTTWDEWQTWISAPVDTLVWLTDIIDVGPTNTQYNLEITTTAEGTVEYVVYTSDTGAFAGEETATTISAGATNVPGFSGQFCIVAVQVSEALNIPNIQSVDLRTSNFTLDIQLDSVDTSTLAGTQSARQLELGRAISQVKNIQITPQETASDYAVNMYVSDTATSNALVPRVVDRGTTPTISLRGIDNDPRDGIVDIRLTAFPEQYMSGNNLRFR